MDELRQDEKAQGLEGEARGEIPDGSTVPRNRYRIVRQIAPSSMSAVYLAEDQVLPGGLVVIVEYFDTSQGAQDQFKRQADMLAQLARPYLPRVLDYFTGPWGRQYLVMEYVEDEDLYQALTQREWLPALQEIREARATYQLQPETLASEGVDESGAGAQLDQMAIELSRLSKQVAEVQEQLSSTIQQRDGAPPRGEIDRAREITFREFLGAIWW